MRSIQSDDICVQGRDLKLNDWLKDEQLHFEIDIKAPSKFSYFIVFINRSERLQCVSDSTPIFNALADGL
ncbi:MAG: hypothetical protein QM488_17450, partial [Rhizobiaceae bacterium]